MYFSWALTIIFVGGMLNRWACYDLHEDIKPLSFFRIYELKYNTFDKSVHETSDKAA